MKIAVIGAGAMGSIYGGHLSTHNEVLMIDTSTEVVTKIREQGITLVEGEEEKHYYPKATTDIRDVNNGRIQPADLVILFVKAIYSKSALESNKALIGENTYLMTLQNGAGHEELLAQFTDTEHIIIGTTEDNGAVLPDGKIRHGGTGRTNIGMLCEDKQGILTQLAKTLDECGFQAKIHENIQYLIWDKLFTNVSLSALTAVLQVPMGYIAADAYAWQLAEQLIDEAIQTAAALGLTFDKNEVTEKVRTTSRNNPQGITSICADVKNHRRTEVETISGAVVAAAAKVNVPVPGHRMIVNLIHALESKKEGNNV